MVPDEASGIELPLSDVLSVTAVSVSSSSISDVEIYNVSEKLTDVQDLLFAKISDMFSSFASRVDSRFKCIDQKFTDLGKSSSSQGISDVIQDNNQFSFPAPTTSVACAPL